MVPTFAVRDNMLIGIAYCTSPAAGRVEGIEFDVNTAFDLTTDVLSMSWPI
jgi:hypothetical protein